MKKLTTILILFASVAVGQSNMNNPYTTLHGSNGNLIDFAISFKDLIEYENKCFNDSTYVEYVYRCDMVGCTVYHSPIPQIVREWKHKTPTFEGLMEFLIGK